MASGVTVALNALDKIQEMRIPRGEDRLRIIEFGFKDVKGKDQIDVKQEISQSQLDLAKTDAFSYMKDTILLKDKCAYVLYDWQYDTKETGLKKELVFIMWCHENAKIKERMQYASSREALKQKMEGVKHEPQLCDFSDIASKKAFVEYLGRPNAISMEGEAL